MKKQRNKTNPHKRAGVSTKIRKAQPDQNKPSKNVTPRRGPSATQNKHLHPQKMHDAKKWHQTIHHHTIEFSKNTHPPATRPNQGSHQQTCMSTYQATPSPRQLFQPTRPHPQPATPKKFRTQGDLATPTTWQDTKPQPKQSGAVSHKPGLHSPNQTLPGPPGRRRGALTRHKLRTTPLDVKSPGHRRSGARVTGIPVQTSCRLPPPNRSIGTMGRLGT